MIRMVLVTAVTFWAATASAQQWAEKMFAQRSHDFGNVPRAAKVEYDFVLTNLYAKDIHIASVSASCGCTQPRIAKDTLKPHEQGAIIAAFNTRSFSGQRSARVTVTIDRPQFAQVELQVRGYIRTDVVLDPGLVDLGSISEGATVQKKIRIEHAGRDDWKINGVSTDSPYLSATTKQISRSGGRATYELDVQLKPGAPAGYLKDQLIVATNDRSGHFPVDVEGRVVSELTVSPSTLMLGTLQPGQKVTKQIVIKGAKPFKILDIHCANSAFSFGSSEEAKALHLVPVTFEADATTGKISQSIEIVTDLGNRRSVELSAIGQVSAPLAGK
ncbi:MAG TPA: DUF1573 domain-containing protein [Pirellulales bacterium]|jgi:hypothetical protein|nr:DUF1573 domain-containing protein [Pirellulales bacterium]